MAPCRDRAPALPYAPSWIRKEILESENFWSALSKQSHFGILASLTHNSRYITFIWKFCTHYWSFWFCIMMWYYQSIHSSRTKKLHSTACSWSMIICSTLQFLCAVCRVHSSSSECAVSSKVQPTSCCCSVSHWNSADITLWNPSLKHAWGLLSVQDSCFWWWDGKERRRSLKELWEF